MKKLLLCGIDVGSKELVAATDSGTGDVWEGTFSNDAAGHRKLIRRLTRGGARARVCVEATGIYHLDLCLALEQEKGVEVMVANLCPKDFAREQLRRSTTIAPSSLAARVRAPDGLRSVQPPRASSGAACLLGGGSKRWWREARTLRRSQPRAIRERSIGTSMRQSRDRVNAESASRGSERSRARATLRTLVSLQGSPRPARSSCWQSSRMPGGTCPPRSGAPPRGGLIRSTTSRGTSVRERSAISRSGQP